MCQRQVSSDRRPRRAGHRLRFPAKTGERHTLLGGCHRLFQIHREPQDIPNGPGAEKLTGSSLENVREVLSGRCGILGMRRTGFDRLPLLWRFDSCFVLKSGVFRLLEEVYYVSKNCRDRHTPAPPAPYILFRKTRRMFPNYRILAIFLFSSPPVPDQHYPRRPFEFVSEECGTGGRQI